MTAGIRRALVQHAASAFSALNHDEQIAAVQEINAYLSGWSPYRLSFEKRASAEGSVK